MNVRKVTSPVRSHRSSRRASSLVALGMFSLAMSGLPGCFGLLIGDGTIVHDSRSVPLDVREVEIHDNFDVEVIVDPRAVAPTLTIETDSNLLHHIETTTTGGRLVIESDTVRTLHPTHELKVWLKMPVLDFLQTSGSASAQILGIRQTQLIVSASGASNLEVQGEVLDLQASASGGSDITLEGTGDYLGLQATGGSQIEARGFAARIVDVDGSGGADFEVCASDQISGELSGGSSLEYTCGPLQVSVTRSGGSSIHAD